MQRLKRIVGSMSARQIERTGNGSISGGRPGLEHAHQSSTLSLPQPILAIVRYPLGIK
jgi:hypothetical protein